MCIEKANSFPFEFNILNGSEDKNLEKYQQGLGLQESLRASIAQDIQEKLTQLGEALGTRSDELSSRLEAVDQFGRDCRTAVDELMGGVAERLDKLVADTGDQLEAQRGELMAALAALGEENAAKMAELQQANSSVLKGLNGKNLCLFICISKQLLIFLSTYR